jgi:hypothetical protein
MFIDEWFGKDFYKKLSLGYHKSFFFWTAVLDTFLLSP